MHMRTHTEC